MFGFLKNSELVLKHKQIRQVKELRKESVYSCDHRIPGVITVEYIAGCMAPYNKMPVRKAIKAAKENIKFIGRDYHID